MSLSNNAELMRYAIDISRNEADPDRGTIRSAGVLQIGPLLGLTGLWRFAEKAVGTACWNVRS